MAAHRNCTHGPPNGSPKFSRRSNCETILLQICGCIIVFSLKKGANLFADACTKTLKACRDAIKIRIEVKTIQLTRFAIIFFKLYLIYNSYSFNTNHRQHPMRLARDLSRYPQGKVSLWSLHYTVIWGNSGQSSILYSKPDSKDWIPYFPSSSWITDPKSKRARHLSRIPGSMSKKLPWLILGSRLPYKGNIFAYFHKRVFSVTNYDIIVYECFLTILII